MILQDAGALRTFIKLVRIYLLNIIKEKYSPAFSERIEIIFRKSTSLKNYTLNDLFYLKSHFVNIIYHFMVKILWLLSLL